jgi:dipeptidyl aminopeptidase/acylaminoacyl peptidase
MTRRLASCLAAGAVCLALSGCVPTAWLPDSSGFVYVKPVSNPNDRTQLVHYDLKKKAGKVITNDCPGSTMWPAVNPDGKRVAVAEVKGEMGKAKTLQLTVYGLDGKKLHTSKEFPWVAAADNNISGPALLFWSPKEDRIVVADGNQTGVYDLKGDSIKMYDKSAPLIHGGSPMTPDGKGFLLLLGPKDKTKADDQGRVVLVDWAGKEQLIDVEPLVKLVPKGKLEQSEAMGSFFIVPLVFPSWWDGPSAVAGFKRAKATYAIDTVKKTVVVSEAMAELIKQKKGDDEPLEFDLGGDLTIRVTKLPGENKGKGARNARIAVVNRATKKETVLVEKGPENCLFLPSPNGQYVALCITSGPIGQTDSLTIVVNNKGEEVARLTFDK